jgi:HlyD family secretion protein
MSAMHVSPLVIRLVIVAVLLAAAVAGWRYYSQPETAGSECGGSELIGRVEATVANTRAGTVKPCRRAKLAPQGGGQIARLLVKEGDRVWPARCCWSCGMSIWRRRYAGRRTASAAKARRNEACAAAQAAQREAARQQQLVAQGFVSAAAVDKVVSEAEVREAACRAARPKSPPPRRGSQPRGRH